MSAAGDLGPVLPSPAMLRMKAREIGVLARRAEEFAGHGPTADLSAAIKQFDSIRALVGPLNNLGRET
jgi:hypothetical protein